MKTKNVNTLALIVIAFVVMMISVSSVAAAAAKPVKVTEYYDVKQIHKLVVSGNVDVFLTQGYSEDLKVYNNDKASIEYEDGVLRVVSPEKEKLALELTVTNLEAIEASGNVIIRSMNQLSGIDLNINLKSGAKANVNARVVNFNGHLADSAQLALAGDAENQLMNLSGLAQVETSKFTAQNSSIIVQDHAMALSTRGGVTTRIQAAVPKEHKF